MSAVLQSQEAQLEPMAAEHLGQVLAVKCQTYTHPWSRGNFMDSLQHGYRMQMLTGPVPGQQQSVLLAYFVAMKGVDEVHLLNLTVAPAWQRQGWAQVMLDALAIWARGQGAQWLWLEVRASNERAQHVYRSNGFRRVGLRKAYYPASDGVREDAIVMSFKL